MASLRVNHCIALLSLLLLSPTASLAQSSAAKPDAASSASSVPAPPPVFDIADVHPSPYAYNRNFRWNTQGTDRFLIHQASSLDLIAFAYKLDPDHVFGGPTWLAFDRYDIIAGQPASTPVDTTRLKVRALLADRFKLVAHDDTRPMPAQLLTAGKGGPMMKPAADTTVPAMCKFQQPPAPPAPDAPLPASYSYSCRNMTMQQYVNWIPGAGRTRIPIVDQTGLKGAWDFDVTYTLLPARNGYDIANDLDKIGLKLTMGESQQPVLVIDSLNETPTPNSPRLAELLPPPVPPSFDVAVIKPSSPDYTGDPKTSVTPSGQMTITHTTLQLLIGAAYNLSGANIADIPDFLAKDHWDIIAKVPQDAYPRRPNGSPIFSGDDNQLMMRSLLAERFGLKAHLEDRPFDSAWILTAASPKLKKTADPSARTSCDFVPPPGEKDPRTANPIRNRAMWCRNITMAQFASELMSYGWDEIKSPVLDATHLDGSYDIALNWSASRVARGIETIDGRTINNNNVANADSGAASDPMAPTGAISLRDAIAKQLGLKLGMERRNMPMLVLDHIERNPTEN